MTDNFEEIRAAGKAARAKPVKTAAVPLPVAADIAAVALVAPTAPEPIEITVPTPPVPTSTVAVAPDQPQKEVPMATTAETITHDTAAVTNEMTQTGTKLFADMNDRAKSTMERGSKLVEEMNGFTKGNVEAMVESTRIAAKGMEAMTTEAAEQARRAFETMTANLRELMAVKSPTEFMKVQADQTRAAFDDAVTRMSHSTEATLKLVGEVAQPISNRVALMADRIKTAA